jgi:hypothetical protein
VAQIVGRCTGFHVRIAEISMNDLKQVRALLDEINAAISSYDPVLKEQARDILLDRAFAGIASTPVRGRGPQPQAANGPDAMSPAPQERSPRRAGTRSRDTPGARAPGAPRRARRSLQLRPLLERWEPETMAERALLGAYVLSKGKADRTVTSQSINAELKRAEIPVPNITRAIESNLRQKPPLMAQKKKMGSTRQARKQYAITADGVAMVEERIAGSVAAAAA